MRGSKPSNRGMEGWVVVSFESITSVCYTFSIATLSLSFLTIFVQNRSVQADRQTSAIEIAAVAKLNNRKKIGNEQQQLNYTLIN